MSLQNKSNGRYIVRILFYYLLLSRIIIENWIHWKKLIIWWLAEYTRYSDSISRLSTAPLLIHSLTLSLTQNLARQIFMSPIFHSTKKFQVFEENKATIRHQVNQNETQRRQRGDTEEKRMASKSSSKETINRISERLLSGWKLLGDHCPLCNTPLMSKVTHRTCLPSTSHALTHSIIRSFRLLLCICAPTFAIAFNHPFLP